MKIAIDATGLNPQKTGTVTYLVEILGQWNANTQLQHQFVIFCTPNTRHHFDALKLDNRFELVMAPTRKLLQMIWQQTALPLFLWRHKVDVHWGPGFVLPLIGVCPMAVTIHDMTFDLFPEVHEPIKRFYFPLMIRRAVKRAAKVFAISQSTASDLNRLLPHTKSKTMVTPLAARTFGALTRDAGSKSVEVNPKPYALFVGTLEPRKNLERLLQAWQRLPAPIHNRYDLIVIGVKGWMTEGLQANAADSVRFVGHLSDTDLQQYLQQATCFVYPSLYEGFGLPVIEAMAAGVPVLTSNVGATREVAVQAALLVDPCSIEGICTGLDTLLTNQDLRRQLSAAGIKRAGEFTWYRTADLTLKGLSQVA